MENIGIKDPIASLNSSKHAKRPKSDWTDLEKASDNKMRVTHVPLDSSRDHFYYTCSIPWKNGDRPLLDNNANAIFNRQQKTTSPRYLEKKGTSMTEIEVYFKDLENKG